MTAQGPPSGLGESGRALWADVLSTFDLGADERLALEHLCRTADVLAALAAHIEAHGVVDGDGKPTPAVVEHRSSAIAFARLRAALRVPEDAEEGDARPQRRAGVRQPYRVAGAA